MGATPCGTGEMIGCAGRTSAAAMKLRLRTLSFVGDVTAGRFVGA
jgi:hypothetical protein